MTLIVSHLLAVWVLVCTSLVTIAAKRLPACHVTQATNFANVVMYSVCVRVSVCVSTQIKDYGTYDELTDRGTDLHQFVAKKSARNSTAISASNSTPSLKPSSVTATPSKHRSALATTHHAPGHTTTRVSGRTVVFDTDATNARAQDGDATPTAGAKGSPFASPLRVATTATADSAAAGDKPLATKSMKLISLEDDDTGVHSGDVAVRVAGGTGVSSSPGASPGAQSYGTATGTSTAIQSPAQDSDVGGLLGGEGSEEEDSPGPSGARRLLQSDSTLVRHARAKATMSVVGPLPDLDDVNLAR